MIKQLVAHIGQLHRRTPPSPSYGTAFLPTIPTSISMENVLNLTVNCTLIPSG